MSMCTSNHHQGGHRRSFSSYNGKPPLDNRYPTVPLWEKKFCAMVGSVSWQKLIECKRYMSLHPNVVNWDDSAVKEAFKNAKNKFRAEINGIPWDIPLPDPNIYIDDVDWNASVDPELYLDVEKEANASNNMEEKAEVDVALIIDRALLLKQSYSDLGFEPTGWGDEEEEEEKLTKPFDPNYAALGLESNQNENNETNSWERYCAPDERAAKVHGCQNGQNDSQGWIKVSRKKYGRRRNGGGGGRRGNLAYVDKVATPPSAW